MRRLLSARDVDAAVKGGSVFACGGGGWPEHGREIGRLSMTIGRPELVTLDEIPDDAWIATINAIGAPGGLTDWELFGRDYLRAVTQLQEAFGKPLYGLIPGENGMSSTLNAWLPSAALGLKVVDAAGDVRAHPTGDMGSLRMASSPEPVIQTAAGGTRAGGAYLEVVVRGATAVVSPILRRAADRAGGIVVSVRNPLPARYIRDNAALGAISLALDLGAAITTGEPRGGDAVVEAICNATSGTVIARGNVANAALRYVNEAFDVGTIALTTTTGTVTLHVMNEFMAVDAAGGARVASYPDVICALDPNGRPVSAGAISARDHLTIVHVPHVRLPLASSVTDPAVYPAAESMLGIELARYAPLDHAPSPNSSADRRASA